MGAQAAAFLAVRYDLLLAVARRCGAGTEAEDAVQSALTNSMRSCEFRTEEEALHWGKVATINATRKLLRRRRRRQALSLSGYDEDWGVGESILDRYIEDRCSPGPQEHLLDVEWAAAADARLDALPPRQRLAVEGVAAGWSHPELSERLGISERTLRRDIGRAYRALEVAR